MKETFSKKKKSLCVFIDVEEAFDHTSYESIAKAVIQSNCKMSVEFCTKLTNLLHRI